MAAPQYPPGFTFQPLQAYVPGQYAYTTPKARRGPGGKFIKGGTGYVGPAFVTSLSNGQPVPLPVVNPSALNPGEVKALRAQRRAVLLQRAQARAARKNGQAVPRGLITQLTDQSRNLLAQIRPYTRRRPPRPRRRMVV